MIVAFSLAKVGQNLFFWYRGKRGVFNQQITFWRLS